jgi:hypothetical protein
VVKLRHKTTMTGVIIAAPARVLATSGTIVPCRNLSFSEFHRFLGGLIGTSAVREELAKATGQE